MSVEHFQGHALLHDDDCAERYQRGACRCSPEYVLEELTPENYIAGLEGERAWRRPS